MDQQIARRPALPSTGDVSKWTDQEKAVVTAAGLVFHHTYGAREGQQDLAPRPVVEQFLHLCAKTGLDPLARQIYCVGRLGRGEVQWSIQTGIDGFRVIAERHGQYAGQGPAEWMTRDGVWTDVWVKEIHGDHPVAARATIYRHDFDHPLTAVAAWESYAQTKRDGGLTSMWEKMGSLMLAKCAEALALRKAFPHDLSGLYTADEMSQATNETGADLQIEAPQIQPEAPIPSSTNQGEPARDWLAEIANMMTSEDANVLWAEARDAGQLDAELITVDGEADILRNVLWAQGVILREGELAKTAREQQEADVTDAEVVQEDPSEEIPTDEEPRS